MNAQALGLDLIVCPWRGLSFEVGSLGQFHLDGMQPFGWSAIVTGGPAALKTTVGYG